MDTAARKNFFNILIVDDNPGDVRLMQEALMEGSAACRLQVAADGMQALDLLRSRPPGEAGALPDLIFLDLNLPGKTGMQVLEEIKTDPELRPIPVVVFSTSAAAQDIRAAYDRHANCYITKPIDLDVFMRGIRLIRELWLGTAELPREETAWTAMK